MCRSMLARDHLNAVRAEEKLNGIERYDMNAKKTVHPHTHRSHASGATRPRSFKSLRSAKMRLDVCVKSDDGFGRIMVKPNCRMRDRTLQTTHSHSHYVYHRCTHVAL